MDWAETSPGELCDHAAGSGKGKDGKDGKGKGKRKDGDREGGAMRLAAPLPSAIATPLLGNRGEFCPRSFDHLACGLQGLMC